MEVLQLIAEGNANKMSADILHISIKTVEKHRHSQMLMFGLIPIGFSGILWQVNGWESCE